MDRPKEQVPADSPFDLGRPAPAPAADDVFDLGRKTPPRRKSDDVFALDETSTSRAASPAAPAVPAAPAPPEPTGDGDLFPELASRASRQRYLASLASEGIFEVEPLPEPVAAPAPAVPPVEDASWLEEEPAPVAAPLFDLVPPELAAPVAPSPEEPVDLWPEDELAPLPELELPGPLAPPEIEAAPEPEPVRAAEPAATATLGELYLRQGHLDEAGRIFHEVLQREPDNAAARAGLGRIEEDRQTPAAAPPPPAAPALDAGQLLAGFRPGPDGGGTTARKIFLLNRYLDRLRGRQPHVP